jgi:hypothetical protein
MKPSCQRLTFLLVVVEGVVVYVTQAASLVAKGEGRERKVGQDKLQRRSVGDVATHTRVITVRQKGRCAENANERITSAECAEAGRRMRSCMTTQKVQKIKFTFWTR